MPRATRVALFSLLVAALVVAGYFAYQHFFPRLENRAGPLPLGPNHPWAEKPAGKLVVLVVFDQMRGDYLAKWEPYFTRDGFNRLKREGVWYSDAHIPYGCTSTGPGHASLATGSPPSVTGIIENDWWDRKAAARVYCVQPSRPYERVPPLPANSAEPGREVDPGFSPERLLAETVGDKLKAATDGKGRVVSLSIKDRSAALMGGRKPDAVYCFDTRDGVFHTGAYYRDQPHSWVTEFNAAKPADRWFKEKWALFRPELDYAKAVGRQDDTRGESSGGTEGQGRAFPHPYNVKQESPGQRYYDTVERSPAGSELLFDLAKKAVVAEKLGQADATDLLCLGFSSNDIVGHSYGPDSWEVFDMTLRADQLIADLMAFLDGTVGKDRYTLVISSDHGVCPLPELDKNPYPAARRVKVTDVYTRLATELDKDYGITPDGPTQWFETGGGLDRVWPWIYLNQKAITARGLKVEEIADYARDWLADRDYLQTAFTRKQIETEKFADGSLGAKVKLAYYPDRCGDVIVVPAAGVLITEHTSGTSHGTPHPYDTHVPILATGAGVPALGKRTEKVSSLIVAPILAKSLGIDPPAHALEKLPAGLGVGE